MVAPFTRLIGRSFNSSSNRGLVFSSTSNSVTPILAVPLGKTRFCALTALTTSWGERFFALSDGKSRSTQTNRVLPP